MSNTTYSISELAKEFDITTRTIRFYEDKGFIKPARQGQTRIYSAADKTKLKLILRGKRLGFSLDESNEIISIYEPKNRAKSKKQLNTLMDGIRQRKNNLQQQIKDIEAMMSELNEAEQQCVKSLAELEN